MRQELGDEPAGVTLLDMTELGRNPARVIPAFLSFAASHRDRPVCCISEPVWPGRTAAEMHEAARQEALLNLAFRDSPIINDGQETASTTYLAPPGLPPGSNQALSRPPGHAETLSYLHDLRVVRSLVASTAERAGLSPARACDLVLAVSELAANTLRHTPGAGTVQVWQTRDEIICQVTDAGQITDPLAGHRPATDGLLGGNGLWLVNQVCDLVQSRTGPAGTTTRLHMRRYPHVTRTRD